MIYPTSSLATFAVTLVIAAPAGRPSTLGRCSAIPHATFEYQNDHRALVAKDDDWQDPTRPADLRLVADGSARALVAGKKIEIPVASVTWGATVRAQLRLSAKVCKGNIPTLEAKTSSPWLAFVTEGTPQTERDGSCVFELVTREPLPHVIRELAGEVQWTITIGRHRIDLGRSHHALLITAGPSRRANAWAMTGAGTVPQRPDHNAFTLYRLRSAVHIADGADTGIAAAEAAWRYTQKHYDISADPELNPWALLEDGQYGQCMTAGAFIEAVYTILGFQSGKIVYVYPALSRPKNPNLRVFPHAAIPGSFTVEGDAYDVRGQFRSVVADGTSTVHKHSAAEAARHRGAHGIERLMFRDWTGHLHNYATAFIVEEDGMKNYFGGGYAGRPCDNAEVFLAASCVAVVWVYEEGDSDEWENMCDGPDSGYLWQTGKRFLPEARQ